MGSPETDDFEEKLIKLAKKCEIKIDSNFIHCIKGIRDEYHCDLSSHIPDRPKVVRDLDERVKALAGEIQFFKGMDRGVAIRFPSLEELNDDICALERLAKNAGIVRDELHQSGRPQNAIEINTMFGLLALAYEKFTKEQLGFSDKRNKNPGKGFISEMAKLIEPALSDEDCNRRYEAAVRLRRKTRKRPELRAHWRWLHGAPPGQ